MMEGERIDFARGSGRTILVTGGAGFIGRSLTRRLLDDGHRVVVYDLSADHHDLHVGDQPHAALRSVVGDILDREHLETVLHDENVEMIFHLAARVGVRHGEEEAEEYRRVNVDGTERVLQAAVRAGRIPLFFASSSSVYGPHTPLPIREEERVEPISHYGLTKREGERLCRIARLESGLDVRIGRFFTVYGPNGRPDMAIPRLIEAARSGSVFVMSGDGETRRDWTFIEDTIDGALRLMGGGHPVVLMNIGTGEATSLRSVISRIETMMGATIALSTAPRHRFDLAETLADLTLASATGYRARYDIDSGLFRCLNSPQLDAPCDGIERHLTLTDH